MAKIVRELDPYVKVIPTVWSWTSSDPHKRWASIKSTCEDIASQIKRHIDNYDGIEIVSDVEEVCEFCDEPWEVDNEGYPVCCDEAVEEWKMLRKEKQDGTTIT